MIDKYNTKATKKHSKNIQDCINNTVDNKSNTLTPLKIGVKYDKEALNKFFAFIDNYHSGIKLTKKGNIVLFYYSKSKYNNIEKDGIIYYIGQNTGSKKQILLYGNKALYDNFLTGNGCIFLFKDNIYKGEFIIFKQPFQNDDGQWVFPLKSK